MPYLTLMVKLGLGLALVILLAWGTVFLLRKSAFGQQFGAAGTNIRVMERFYLGPKKAIYLVEIGGRPLALGVTDSAITPLSQWQPGELELTPRPGASPSFAAQFRSLLGQQPGRQEG
ncbi:MAG: flagellar biosynthetic protein FliO [Candidatus Latescibacteria bacterium]|nr:flagellar biosynthetic protein FliO [Candidatus Latescibacterota bacterium]